MIGPNGHFDPASIVGAAPKPSPTIEPKTPETPKAEPTKKPHPKDGQKDDHGVEFDSSIHSGGMNGKTGRWMPKRTKKAKAQTDQTANPAHHSNYVPFTQSTTPNGEPNPTEAKPKRPALLANGGEFFTGLWYQANGMIHGEGAKPSGKEEHEMIVASFQDCIDQYADIGEIPPWLGLGLSLGTYQVIRFANPKEPTKAEKAKATVKLVYLRAKAFLFGKRKEEPTEPKEAEETNQ